MGGRRSPLALDGLICFVPLVLLAADSVGSQVLGVTGWQLRSARGSDFWVGIFRELRLGTIGGVLATIAVSLTDMVDLPFWLLGAAIGLGYRLYVVGRCHLWPDFTDAFPAPPPARKPGKRAIARPHHCRSKPEHFPCSRTVADWAVAR